MGLLRTAGGLAAIVAVAAYFSKPGPGDVDEALRRALYEKLFTEEPGTGRDMLGNAMILGCRLDPAACYEVIRRGVEVSYADRVFYATVTVEGFGRRAECWGAFTRFTCPGGFEPAP